MSNNRPMNRDKLREIGAALYGPRWQSALARDLNVHRDSVRGWARGRTAISEGVAADLRELATRRMVALRDALKTD